MNQFQIIPLISYIAVPGLFIIRIWRNHNKDLGKWLLETIFGAAYISSIFLIGVWSMTYGHYIRYFLLIAFLATVIKSFWNVKRKFMLKSLGIKEIITYTIICCTSGVLIMTSCLAFRGSFCPPYSVDLEFPLRGGEFCVVHGGANETVNHHYSVSAQKYALDIVQTNNLGLRSAKFLPENVADFYIYGAPVHSPCDGVVLDAIDQYNDQIPGQMDAEHIAGNYLTITKSDSDIVILLAHLMKGSLLVKKGERVQKGQILAKVGNTGNTSEPHLHIHSFLNHTGDFLFTGKGIPMKFQGQFLTRNDIIKK